LPPPTELNDYLQGSAFYPTDSTKTRSILWPSFFTRFEADVKRKGTARNTKHFLVSVKDKARAGVNGNESGELYNL